jgi:hypothetical protein
MVPEKEIIEVLKSIDERITRMENYQEGRYSLLHPYISNLDNSTKRIGRHLGLRNKSRQD